MNQPCISTILVILVSASLVPLSHAAPEYRLERSAIGSVGGDIVSKSYQITGMGGQPVVDLSTSEKHVLKAGFWAGTYGCVVNLTDLAHFVDAWLTNSGEFGYNLDDFAMLADYWLCPCPADWPLK